MGKVGRTNSSLISIIIFFMLFAVAAITPQIARGEDAAKEDALLEDEFLFEEEEDGIADPLEPLNRAFFQFNDKLYFWALKPAATGYEYVVAEDIRVSVRDFFYNLLSPVRIINNLLQGKVKESGTETARFFINTTIGVAGFGDPARKQFGLVTSDEDMGQTLGKYGVGEGVYFVWPLLGPSNVRDTFGMVGDTFLSPFVYLSSASTIAGLSARGGERINDVSLKLGDYEQFKEASFDPYLALRDAYRQYRNGMIKDETDKVTEPAYSELLEEQDADEDQVQNVADRNDIMRDHQVEEDSDSAEFYTDLGPFVDLTQEYQLHIMK